MSGQACSDLCYGWLRLSAGTRHASGRVEPSCATCVAFAPQTTTADGNGVGIVLLPNLTAPNRASTADRLEQVRCDRDRDRNGLRQLPCRLQEQVELTRSGADTSAGCAV